MHKGFWFRAVLNDGAEKELSGYRSIPDMLLAIRQSGWKSNPCLSHLHLFVGSKHLFTITHKELYNMPTLTDFNQSNPNVGGRPFASQADKATLAAFKLPFTIADIRQVESSFMNEHGEPQMSLQYDIDLDTSSINYQAADKITDLKSSYTLTLPATARRIMQWKQVFEGDYIPNEKPVTLAKVGRGYEFNDAV